MTLIKKIIPFYILFIISFNQIFSNEVLLGIDILERQNFSILQGKRVGLITNQTGVNNKLESTIDIFKRAKNFKLVSVFAPEHGVKGLVGAGQLFESFYDSTDGIMFYALYGKTSKPTKQMLSNIDVLVYDIQDIGVRSYTYISTLGLAMEAAGENNIEFVVLDRPNPLGGYRIEGNVVEDEFRSFVSQFEIPYVYGLTCGELATVLNEKKSLGLKTKCKLTIVKMKGWKRWMKFHDTDLVWVPTSPNVPQKETPFYLVATGVLGELLVFNIGISYTLSFEVIAQEWINADTLARKLNDLKLKGVLFRPVSFKPYYGDWKDKIMNGVQIHITDFDKVNLLELQFYFLQVHNKLYPDKNPFEMCNASRLNMFDKVMGTDKIRKEFSKRFSVDDIKPILDKDIKWFRELSRRFYLYN